MDTDEQGVIFPDIIHPTHAILRVARGGVIVGKPARIDMDRFGEMLDRSNGEFGDPSRDLGGPKLPKVEEVKRRRA